jgi:hypothetical protein
LSTIGSSRGWRASRKGGGAHAQLFRMTVWKAGARSALTRPLDFPIMLGANVIDKD